MVPTGERGTGGADAGRGAPGGERAAFHAHDAIARDAAERNDYRRSSIVRDEQSVRANPFADGGDRPTVRGYMSAHDMANTPENVARARLAVRALIDERFEGVEQPPRQRKSQRAYDAEARRAARMGLG